jgi:hypothetical protein
MVSIELPLPLQAEITISPDLACPSLNHPRTGHEKGNGGRVERRGRQSHALLVD